MRGGDELVERRLGTDRCFAFERKDKVDFGALNSFPLYTIASVPQSRLLALPPAVVFVVVA